MGKLAAKKQRVVLHTVGPYTPPGLGLSDVVSHYEIVADIFFQVSRPRIEIWRIDYIHSDRTRILQTFDCRAFRSAVRKMYRCVNHPYELQK